MSTHWTPLPKEALFYFIFLPQYTESEFILMVSWKKTRKISHKTNI